jgi:hypothetical protein
VKPSNNWVSSPDLGPQKHDAEAEALEETPVEMISQVLAIKKLMDLKATSGSQQSMVTGSANVETEAEWLDMRASRGLISARTHS